MSNVSQIEALLFVAGDEGVSLADLSELTGFDKAAIQQLVDELSQHYISSSSALMVRSTADGFAIVTKPELGATVSRYFNYHSNQKLTTAQLESLVIIAYRQPITRIEVDQIRGVKSSATIQKLVQHGLIEAVGRRDVIGRPIMYGTTTAFLDYFGLTDLNQLPALPDIDDLELDEGSDLAAASQQLDNLFGQDADSSPAEK